MPSVDDLIRDKMGGEDLETKNVKEDIENSFILGDSIKHDDIFMDVGVPLSDNNDPNTHV